MLVILNCFAWCFVEYVLLCFLVFVVGGLDCLVYFCWCVVCIEAPGLIVCHIVAVDK